MTKDPQKVSSPLPLERIRGTRTGGPKLLLAGAFGYPIPKEELVIWDSMTAEQKEEAARRLRILLKFEAPLRRPTVEEAAADMGFGMPRWYSLQSDWRERRSLSSIGIFADVPRSKARSHHGDLERLVVGIVDAAEGAEPPASVRTLASDLAEAYGRDTGLAEADWPSVNTFRKFVEAELRRRSTKQAPGADVAFDCCACDLPRSDGTFVAFLIIDKGTGAVLGATLGDAADSRAGYAAAAKDALGRIEREPLDVVAWADGLASSELVIGLDEQAWADHAAEMASAGMRGQLVPTTKVKRFGAFVRPLIGPRMGRVKFQPGRTKEAAGPPPTADDQVRFRVEVDLHNSARLEGAGEDGSTEPPAMLVALLKRLSRR